MKTVLIKLISNSCMDISSTLNYINRIAFIIFWWKLWFDCENAQWFPLIFVFPQDEL